LVGLALADTCVVGVVTAVAGLFLTQRSPLHPSAVPFAFGPEGLRGAF
jgi:hypothetical protein